VVLSSALVLGLPAVLTIKLLRRRIDATATAIAEYRQAANRNLVTALQGIKDVKAYGQEDAFCRAYHQDAMRAHDMQARQEVLANMPNWILETLGFLLLCLASFLMYFSSGDSPLRVTGTLALLAVAAWRGLPASIRVVTSITNFRGYLPYVHHTLTNMERINTWAAAGGGSLQRVRPNFTHDIQAADISFQYEGSDTPVLSAVSFHVTKGETLGIVGESGAGKSTLMDLLMGLLAPSQGALCLDGKPLDEVGRRGLAEIIGYVPQFPYIYDASLAENVAFGVPREEINQDRVAEACRLAAADEFLSQLPQGYETVLGERGVRLSGGQQQRICIARALYRKPEVLIFDEATSSLDTKSERQIQQTILRLKGQVTMILVAHRLSTVEGCDRLVWLEQGGVRKLGSPSEVLPDYRAVLARHLRSGAENEESLRTTP
jgi:ABC-type multidrug transport system fused ATPase/permease subunit